MADKPGKTAIAEDRAPAPNPELTPEMVAKIEAARGRIHAGVGQVALAMAALPRYRNLALSDLMPLVLDPLMRDRIAIASTTPPDGKSIQAPAGVAIWASVSAEVDARIREQIGAGVFPVRLQSDDWASGDINWLLDVIAPTEKLAASVIANFKQVVKDGDLRMHPLISRLVSAETLRKMGAVAMDKSTGARVAGADATQDDPAPSLLPDTGSDPAPSLLPDAGRGKATLQ